MPARRRAPAAALTVVLALTVALVVGCTSSNWDTSEIDDTTPTTAKRYPATEAGTVDSLADHLSTVGPDLGQWAAPRDQARCAAERIVDQLTLDRLDALGYDRQAPTLALAWSETERTTVINTLSSCIDFSAAILETISSYQKLGLAQSNCLATGYERLGLTRDLAAAVVDGAEPDPFANNDRVASGMAQLAVECMGDEDLLPNAPMPRLPAGEERSPTTTGTTVPDDGRLDGIEPGSPLDTTTTIP